MRIGLLEVLTLVPVVLKLTGLIAWSWLWVFFLTLVVFSIFVLLNVIWLLWNR